MWRVRYRIRGEPLIRAAHASAAVAGRPPRPQLCRGYTSNQRISRSPWASRLISTVASVTRTFCGHCGTPLTYWKSSYGRTIDVTTCSLDDPERFPPVGHVWTSHKLRWVKPATACLASRDRHRTEGGSSRPPARVEWGTQQIVEIDEANQDHDNAEREQNGQRPYGSAPFAPPHCQEGSQREGEQGRFRAREDQHEAGEWPPRPPGRIAEPEYRPQERKHVKGRFESTLAPHHERQAHRQQHSRDRPGGFNFPRVAGPIAASMRSIRRRRESRGPSAR